MCLKGVFRNWKEVCKVSFVVVLVFSILEFLIGEIFRFNFMYGIEIVFVQGFSTIIFLGVSLLTTTMILDKKLKKDNWPILLGNILVILFYLVIEFIFDSIINLF